MRSANKLNVWILLCVANPFSIIFEQFRKIPDLRLFSAEGELKNSELQRRRGLTINRVESRLFNGDTPVFPWVVKDDPWKISR